MSSENQQKIERILGKMREKLRAAVEDSTFYGAIGLTVNIRSGEVANFVSNVEESEK